MIYKDSNIRFVRLQNKNYDYLIIPNLKYNYTFCKRPIHLEFPNNKPIGPTILVEWEDE